MVKHNRLPSEQNVTWVDLQIEASLLRLSQLLGMSPAQTSRVLVHTNRCVNAYYLCSRLLIVLFQETNLQQAHCHTAMKAQGPVHSLGQINTTPEGLN